MPLIVAPSRDLFGKKHKKTGARKITVALAGGICEYLFMSPRFYRNIFIIGLLLATACSGRFVKREQLAEINKKFGADTREYTVLRDLDIGNGEQLKKGTVVRIWVESNSFSVKVKAYRSGEDREKTVGQNILYMHENEFEDEDFDERTFTKLLNDLIAPVVSPEAAKP